VVTAPFRTHVPRTSDATSDDASQSSDASIVRKLTAGVGLWPFSAVGLSVLYDVWQRRGLANDAEWVVGFYVVVTVASLFVVVKQTAERLTAGE
jgi:hypothetical protein